MCVNYSALGNYRSINKFLYSLIYILCEPLLSLDWLVQIISFEPIITNLSYPFLHIQWFNGNYCKTKYLNVIFLKVGVTLLLAIIVLDYFFAWFFIPEYYASTDLSLVMRILTHGSHLPLFITPFSGLVLYSRLRGKRFLKENIK